MTSKEKILLSIEQGNDYNPYSCEYNWLLLINDPVDKQIDDKE